MDESILLFSRVYLSKIISRSSLHFVGIRVFIVEYVKECKKPFFLQNRGLWRVTRDWDKSRVLVTK